MIQLSSEILSLSGEAFVIAENGKTVFANAHARELLGADCEGEALSALFGEDIARAESDGFAAAALIKGRHCTVRAARLENGRLAFFVTCPPPEAVRVSDAFLSALRSALMTVSVSMELCRVRADETGDEELGLGLAALTKSYYNMTRLLSNVTTAQEIMRGELSPCFKRVDAAKLFRSLIDGAAIFCSAPEITLNVSGSAELSADPLLLEQLLLNLLSNSLIHARGCTHIAVNAADSGDSVILSVTDDGCGIPADALHSVFERYAHEFDLKGMNGGAGLGLTVARGIAEAHGGTLLLESREGHGTTVRASLRRQQTGDSLRMRAREKEYSSGVKSILAGLAGALPPECFTAKYMD